MTAFTTLSEMIARQRSDAIAITAPSAKPLSYGALNALVGRTVQTLNGLGIGRGDRVGLVLPNCPEMATAFVAVAGACTCAPLNMAYRADEFEFYLSDLNAKALIVAQGSETPARAVAAKLGIAVIELLAHPERGPTTWR
jgi:acyl-CoA synthetase (AMP-forming)/AMP-acid ligase II